MRNIRRTSKPHCLTKNSRKWTREFLSALRRGDQKLIKQRRMRYNHGQVRTGLDDMYGNRCCYCESAVGPVRADQIEHRKPIEHFPRLAFEWTNMHLACGGCNNAKSNKWNNSYPILDAAGRTPIGRHLHYKSTETGVRRVWLTPRGRTTVRDADLNREQLRLARTLIMAKVLGVLEEIRNRRRVDPLDISAANSLEELREMYTGQYGSMISWLVETYL